MILSATPAADLQPDLHTAPQQPHRRLGPLPIATATVIASGYLIWATTIEHPIGLPLLLLAAVTAAAAMALDNGMLRAERSATVEHLRSCRARVIEAGHRERRRLERDLHDGPQQRLVAMSLDLGVLEQRLGSDPAARAAIAQARQAIAATLDELRDLAHGLHPAVLSGHGLRVALESLTAQAPVATHLSADLAGRLAEPVEVAAYYVVCEALANIGKHAQATQATIDVGRVGDTLIVEILDNGIGGADPRRGTGLRGLTDRVEALGGRLQVHTPTRHGTLVRAEIPCGTGHSSRLTGRTVGNRL